MIRNNPITWIVMASLAFARAVDGDLLIKAVNNVMNVSVKAEEARACF